MSWLRTLYRRLTSQPSRTVDPLLGDFVDEGICPKCGRECGRDEVHNGICMLYGPWGCQCGWSEDARYDLSAGQSPMQNGGRIDQRGGWKREPIPSIVRRQGAAKPDDEFRGWMLEFELKRYRDESAWWADLMRVEGNCDA